MDTDKKIEITQTEKYDGTYTLITSGAKEAIARFRERQKEKSFSERHPELGKMIKCQICKCRHRTAEICLQQFAKDENEVERIAPGPGKGHGRILPHWSKKRLQVVDLTRQILPTLPMLQKEDGTKELNVKKARSMALNILRKEWHTKSNRVQRIQKRSRKINRGRS